MRLHSILHAALLAPAIAFTCAAGARASGPAPAWAPMGQVTDGEPGDSIEVGDAASAAELIRVLISRQDERTKRV